jgi:tRNA nucleotidyltransferase (CCA-adding enzyme)
MKTYLVGGAVRDKLLNYPVEEYDWVVVGTTAEVLLKQGYQQVGRDFPVFLHPTTHEEYALARKERKLAPGYYGFACDFSNKVSLEEDLARRDLTINAIAMDEEGNLIDPHHGIDDLKEKKLRHVSSAFSEDPVRLLRIARFAARYHHLGFTIAAETRHLMYQMVKRKEVNHLVPERIWQEWHKSLTERNPEVFITTLRECGALAIIFPEINALFGVPNCPINYLYIDSGLHALNVLKMINKSQEPMVRFTALVLDLGKALTAITHWPKHHEHKKESSLLIQKLCNRLRIPVSYRKFASMASRYYPIIHRLDDLCAGGIVTLLEQTDAFRQPSSFEKLLMICQADDSARLMARPYLQAEKWRYLLTTCLAVPVANVLAQGYRHEAIKKELHQRRVASVELILNSWKLYDK